MQEIVMAQFTDMLVQIVASIVLAIVGVIASLLGKKLVEWRNLLKADKKNDMLVETVDKIILAVEQQFSGELGSKKKEYATQLLAEYTDKFGIHLSAKQVDTLIESAVGGLRQWYSPSKQIEG